MKKPSISIVIPALNEEGNIEEAVPSVVSALANCFQDYEIVIINDGSSDRTGVIADRFASENPNISVIHHKAPIGMGESLKEGFQKARMDYIGSFPGDNALHPSALPTMFTYLGQADIVTYFIANVDFRSKSRQFLSSGFTTIMNLILGLRLRYFNGHAIYRREILHLLPLVKSGGHTFLPELLARLVKKGHSFIEVGTLQQKRAHGQTKAVTISNFSRSLLMLFKLTWEFRVVKS